MAATAHPSAHDPTDPIDELFGRLGATEFDRAPVALAIHRMASRIPWLADELFRFGPNLSADISNLAAGQAPPTTLKGLGLDPVLRSLLSRTPRPPEEFEQARAVILTFILRQYSSSPPSKGAAVSRLASATSGAVTKMRSPIRGPLMGLVGAASADEACARFVTALASNAELSEDVQRAWEKLGRPRTAPPAPLPPSPVPGPSPSPIAARPPSGQSTSGWRVTGGARVRRLSQVVPSKVGLDPVLREAERSYPALYESDELIDDGTTSYLRHAELALRRANQNLVEGHIDALLPEEAHEFVRMAKKLIGQDPNSPLADDLRILLVSLAIGRAPAKLPATRAQRNEHREYIDLDKGVVWRPVLLDESRAPIELTDQHWVGLPLPPTLLDVPGFAHSIKTMDRIARRLTLAATRALLMEQKIPLAGLSPSRIWHWASVRFQETADDIAATMMLSGDTFARSPAPIYYYRPKHSKLQSVYREAIWPSFGEKKPLTGKANRKEELRIGFAELVDLPRAKRACQTIFDRARVRKPSADADICTIADFHNVIADAALTHYSVITCHRPTNALFQTKRGDIGLATPCALARDKRVDAAHYLRPVGMSAGCSEQIAYFIAHLEKLSESPLLPNNTREHIRAAIAGKRGLFFHLAESGEIKLLLMETWRQGLPESWTTLAANWYRTFVFTALDDRGVLPHARHVHAGHLEAADQPLSEASPFAVASFAKILESHLDDIGKSLGLRCVRGLADTPADHFALTPLKNWTPVLQKQRDRMAAIVETLSRHLSARSKGSNDEQRSEVIEAISEVSPSLAGLLRKQASPAASSPSVLTSNELNQIIEIIESRSEDPISSIALRNTLATLLRTARKTLKWKVPDYSRVVVGRGADITPLLPGMMKACDQIDALRRNWIADRPRIPAEKAVAHDLLGFLLWSPPHDLQTLRRTLRSLTGGMRPDKYDMAVLPVESEIDLSERSSTVVLGYAALIAARLREVNWDEIDIASELFKVRDCVEPSTPEEPADLLIRLLSTLEVNGILEQPRLGELARQRQFCKAAPAERVLSVFGSPTNRATISSISDQSTSVQSKPASSYKPDEVRSEYAELRANLSFNEGKVKTFPLSEVTLTPDKFANGGRQAIVDELSLFAQKTNVRVLNDLASLTIQMLTNSTGRGEKMAVGAVSTYISAIGKRLVNKFLGQDYALEDAQIRLKAYDAIVADLDGTSRLKPRSKQRAFAQLFRFDRHVCQLYGLDPIDRGDIEIDDYDPDEDPGIHANFVTEDDYQRAFS